MSKKRIGIAVMALGMFLWAAAAYASPEAPRLLSPPMALPRNVSSSAWQRGTTTKLVMLGSSKPLCHVSKCMKSSPPRMNMGLSEVCLFRHSVIRFHV